MSRLHLPFFIPAMLSLYIFNRKIATIATVNGHSMSPTLNPNTSTDLDRVLLNKIGTEYNRGDVIFFINPKNHRMTFVKRIVAIQGDFVRNSLPVIADANIMEHTDDDWLVVPSGHVWVESDSSDQRVMDSRQYGPVPLGLVVGKVEMVLYPWNRFGISLDASENRIIDEGRLITKNISV